MAHTSSRPERERAQLLPGHVGAGYACESRDVVRFRGIAPSPVVVAAAALAVAVHVELVVLSVVDLVRLSACGVPILSKESGGEILEESSAGSVFGRC